MYRYTQNESFGHNGDDLIVYDFGVHESRNVGCDIFIELGLLCICVVGMSYIVIYVTILSCLIYCDITYGIWISNMNCISTEGL